MTLSLLDPPSVRGRQFPASMRRGNGSPPLWSYTSRI